MLNFQQKQKYFDFFEENLIFFCYRDIIEEMNGKEVTVCIAKASE